MKLNIINESKVVSLYKGISEYGGLNNWSTSKIGESGRIIPGFLSTYNLAYVYAEPTLTGSEDSNTIIVKFDINKNDIENRTEEYKKWCEENNARCDISCGFPPEWKNDKSIWTVANGSLAHGDANCFDGLSFVYSSVELPYVVVAHFNNQQEWEDAEG